MLHANATARKWIIGAEMMIIHKDYVVLRAFSVFREDAFCSVQYVFMSIPPTFQDVII